MRPLLASLAVLAIGCGSSSPGGMPRGDAGAPDHARGREGGTRDGRSDARPDAGHDASEAGNPYPAAHPAMPVEQDLGGPVMKAPKFVIITFAGDPLGAQIDDFADKVAASKTYWSGTTAEYGVGPVASVLHVPVNETPQPSLTDADVQAWLAGKLSGPDAGTLEGGAPWPAPDTNTLFMIYYPSGVSITQGGGMSCSAFFGYHNDFALAPKTFVSYSVVARCAPFPMTSAIDSLTSIASHELVEAATDPLAQDSPAYLQPDDAHLAWAVPAGGELGDLCAAYGNVFYKPSDVPYLVQRTWSNKSAAEGHDPCQPDGLTPYFNSAADLTANVSVTGGSGLITTKGITIPLGGTGTVTLDLYSDAPTPGPWTVQAADLSSLFGGPQELSATFAGKSTATGKNGDKLTLDVKVLQKDPMGFEVLWITSSIGSAQPTVWLGLVGN